MEPLIMLFSGLLLGLLLGVLLGGGVVGIHLQAVHEQREFDRAMQHQDELLEAMRKRVRLA
jgi:uncharacterized membrane-anchored protein YhcB (DUF1043 family)